MFEITSKASREITSNFASGKLTLSVATEIDTYYQDRQRNRCAGIYAYHKAIKGASLNLPGYHARTAGDVDPIKMLARNLQRFRLDRNTNTTAVRVTRSYTWLRTLRGGAVLSFVFRVNRDSTFAETKQALKESARARVREYREKIKSKPCPRRELLKEVYRTIVDQHGRRSAYVRYVAGLPTNAATNRILNMAEASRASLVFEQKRPMTNEKHFGIEIEFINKQDRSALAAALNRANLAKFVTLKSDGSVHSEGSHPFAHEIAICVPASQAKEVIAGVCDILNAPASDAKVNQSCGLHVHLDMRADALGAMVAGDSYSRLISAQSLLFAMVPEARRTNSFCKLTRKAEFRQASRGHKRYLAINATAYAKYRTIEVRLGAGSVDASQITQWAALLSKIAYEATFKRSPRSLKAWEKACALDNDTTTYVRSMVRAYSPSSPLLDA